ncbi:helix-turn-helix domain-containing protein [Sediminitomix flava]|uniref:AraC-like DNA-binding protein n=1 Tax=Sediminitomix flava TaxID=379075 RepID=A0A315Z8F6_SEDFL|nr:AraC family transcriptional regulator [Sediminitomix flava]PWJ41781.1 AraC-like DNA-binding protein [Sediminitomix flava]
MKRYGFDDRISDFQIMRLLNQIGDVKVDWNHYCAKGDLGEFNLWLYSELGELLQTLIFDIKLEQEYIFEDHQKEQNLYILEFFIDSEIDYGDNIVGAGHTMGAALFNSGQIIKTRANAGENLKGVTCYISGDFMKKTAKGNWDLFQSVISDSGHWVVFESLNLEMEQCLKDIFALQNLSASGKNGFTLAKIIELISHFFVKFYNRKTGLSVSNISEEDKEIMFSIKNDLLRDLTVPPTIKDLSRKYGINDVKLRASFISIFGSSPHQFVMKERLQEARRMVNLTNLNMTEISDMLGFTDSSHFAKQYRKEYGIAPLKERKRKKLF